MCTELKHAVSELAVCSMCDSAYSNIINKCSECRTVGFPAYLAPPPAPPPLRMSVGGVGLPEPVGVLDSSGGGNSKHHTGRGAGCTQEPLSAGGAPASDTVEQRCVLLTVPVSATVCVTLLRCYC